MKMIQILRQNNKTRQGSAMILVVVVTVLLAVVGVMFVMVARVGEMESSFVVDSSDLDAAVDTVVTRVQTVLIEDLFGADGRVLSGSDDPAVRGTDERWDYTAHQIQNLFRPWQDSIQVGPNPGPSDDTWLPGTLDDIWLASLEPVWYGDNGTPADPSDDIFIWPQITDLWGTLQGRSDSLYHQQFTVSQHDFFDGNTGKRWVDPPIENLTAVNWAGVNWNTYGVSAYRVIPRIIRPDSRTGVIVENADGSDATHYSPFGARADADGDGVADSRWVQIPDLTTSRGKPVFAAVRIIDNCAMLNFNTAFGFYQKPVSSDARSWHSKPWYVSQAHVTNDLPYESNGDFGEGLGRILGELDATPFFRAYDRYRVERLRFARDPVTLTKPAQTATTPLDYHRWVISNIESPGTNYTLFGLDDELEIRNRYLLTGKAVARFEKRHFDTENPSSVPPVNPYSGTLYYTFDFGRGIFGFDPTAAFQNSRVKGVPFDSIFEWFEKVDPRLFDDEPNVEVDINDAFKYDRRHISTFYSFDRPLRSGRYPLLETVLAAEPVSRRLPREAIFRPLYHRAIDMRTMTDPANPDRITANTTEARRNRLHLLYAFRAYYMTDGLSQADAATKSAQIVANLIDYLDADSVPTYIDRAYVRQLIMAVSAVDPAVGGVIDIGAALPATPSPYEFGLGMSDPAETVYGYERQPYISEVYCQWVGASGGSNAFAVELINPYDQALSLEGWQIRLGAAPTFALTGITIPAAVGNTLGRLTLWAANIGFNVNRVESGQSSAANLPGFGLGSVLSGRTLYLERPDPLNAASYITVDSVGPVLLMQLVGGNNTIRSLKRDDTRWRFNNADVYQTLRLLTPADSTLGQPNGDEIKDVFPDKKGYQLPVADDGAAISRLADFGRVAFVSSQKGGTTPRPITEQIALAADESAVRYDMASSPRLLDYICFLNRPQQGTLPGRININTAAKHVIAAAIPPQLVMATVDDTQNALYLAEQIVANRPYERVSDLLTKVAAFQKYNNHATADVGDSTIQGDFEERDWIVARLSNIFTARSDTFTAWILVRLGADGPQRRMLAVFDRSQCWTSADTPRLVALHPVSDPR